MNARLGAQRKTKSWSQQPRRTMWSGFNGPDSITNAQVSERRKTTSGNGPTSFSDPDEFKKQVE